MQKPMQKPSKPAQNGGNRAETLRKPCRNPRKLAGNLRKPFGNPAETLRKPKETPTITLWKLKIFKWRVKTNNKQLIFQTNRGFLSGDYSTAEDADAEETALRANVGFTRATRSMTMLSPKDMAGLPGAFQVLATSLHGVQTVTKDSQRAIVILGDISRAVLSAEEVRRHLSQRTLYVGPPPLALLELPVAISVFCNLKNVSWKKRRWFLRSRPSSPLMATGEAPLIAVANFSRFLAPEMVPSRMSNLAVGLWSGLNDLRDGLRLFGCFSICGSYMPGMCLWKWRSVSWSGNFDRL